jgi:hypothetical protein
VGECVNIVMHPLALGRRLYDIVARNSRRGRTYVDC